MPTYKVTDPTTGKTLRLTGDSPPTEDELNDIFKTVQPSAPASPGVGELRRREGQGEVSALQQSVQESSPSFLEKLGAAIGAGTSAQQFKQPENLPESYSKLSPSELGTAVRFGVPAAVGLATAGAGTLPTMAALGLGFGAGEAGGQIVESGKITSPGAIAGATVGGAVPLGGPATSLARQVVKTGALSATAGTARRLTEDLIDGKPVNLAELTKGAAIDFSLGAGLTGLGHAGGAVYRSIGSVGPGELTSYPYALLGELQAPFEAQKISNTAAKIASASKTTAARSLISNSAGKIAQAVRQDPEAVASVLQQAAQSNMAQNGEELANSIVGTLQKQVGALDQNAVSAISDFAGQYELMANRDISSAANLVKDVANEELAKFKSAARERYAPIEADPLFNEKNIGEVPGERIYGVPKGKSINDLRDELTKAYDAIDYTAPVQGATFDKYAKVKEIKDQLNKALDALPAGSPVVQAYKDAQKFYANNIERFKGSYANSILRDIGEEGGGEAAIITKLGGTDGAKYLSELKNLTGDSFPKIRDAVGQQIYANLSAAGPRKLLDNLECALAGQWKGVQPKVLQEFLPQATPEKVRAARAAMELADAEFSKDFRKALADGHELSNPDPGSVLNWVGKNPGRADKVASYLAGEPQLLSDTQDALLTQIIADAQSEGTVSAKALLEVAEKRKDLVSAIMGPSGESKIKAIGDALTTAEKDASKTSVLSKIIGAYAGATAASRTIHATGSIPFTLSSGLAGAYAGERAASYLNNRIAAHLLANPKYRMAVSKPYEELTNRETQMLERELPSVISRLVKPQ